jgi:DNA-directed RNA polymerase specialized sigma24 family protein
MEPPCREAIRDFYIHDLSYKEMAAKRQMPINTVGTRLSRCLEKLKARLEGEVL